MFEECCKVFDDYDKISAFKKYKDVYAQSEGTIDEFI